MPLPGFKTIAHKVSIITIHNCAFIHSYLFLDLQQSVATPCEIYEQYEGEKIFHLQVLNKNEDDIHDIRRKLWSVS